MFKTELVNETGLKPSNVSRNDIVSQDYKTKIEQKSFFKKFPSSAMISEMKCPIKAANQPGWDGKQVMAL